MNMLYCNVDEAFDNSFKRKINKFDKKSKNYRQNQCANTLLDQPFDNYNQIQVNRPNSNSNSIKHNPHDNMTPAYFTADGNITNEGPYYGTTITDLKKFTNNDNDDSVMSDSNSSNSNNMNSDNYSTNSNDNGESLGNLSLSTISNSNISDNSRENNDYASLDHYYCINTFIKTFIENPDVTSRSSTLNDNVYRHIKTCKFCKRKISERTKQSNTVASDKTPAQKLSLSNDSILDQLTQENLGYDLKEIALIILAGIILVFILDLLVRIGRKIKN